jgi:hypothetical protein
MMQDRQRDKQEREAQLFLEVADPTFIIHFYHSINFISISMNFCAITSFCIISDTFLYAPSF